MIILHPFSIFRQKEQAETLDALRKIQGSFRVVNVLCSEKADYDDSLLRFWGTDDLIIVEQDIVPSIEQVQTLADCPESWCGFWYWMRYAADKCPPYQVLNAFGLAKLSLETQKLAPSESWYKRDDWAYYNLDSRVASVLIQKGLVFHVHGEVKHNRAVDWTGKTK
jgi:hypothetical protein